MKLNIRGSKLEVTDAIRSYLESKLKKLDKYFEEPEEITANIVVKTTGIDQIVEITIPIKRVILRAEEKSKDLYASIDFSIDKLERQIRKNKTKIRQRVNKENKNVVIDFDMDEEETKQTIVRRKTVDSKPMSEEEAILQMDLIGHDFFIFKNSDSDAVCVLYRRNDNNYGIIEVI